MSKEENKKGKEKKAKKPKENESNEKPKISRSLSIKSILPGSKRRSRKSITAKIKEHSDTLVIDDGKNVTLMTDNGEFTFRSSDVHVDISDQKCETVPDHVLQMTNLQMLNCGYNRIVKLPENMDVFSNLAVLVVNDNKLDSLPDSIGKLKDLKFIDLHNNYISSFPSSTKNWTNVTKLLLAGNRMASFPPEICHMVSLQRLALDDNSLFSLPERISKLVDLEMLEVTHNYLKVLPSHLWKMPKLKQLRLGHNQIDAIPDSISGLSELTILDLSYNGFTSIPKGVFTLQKLEEFEFAGHGLTSLPKDISILGPTLKRLNLAKNEFVDLPDEFRELKLLEALDLRGNPLAGLAFGQGRWKAVLVDLTMLKNLQTGNLPMKKIHMLNSASQVPLPAGSAPTNPANSGRSIMLTSQNGGSNILPPKPNPAEFGMGKPSEPKGFQGGRTMPAIRGGRVRGRPQVDITSMFEQSGGSNGGQEPTSPKNSESQNTFDLWRTNSSRTISANGHNNNEDESPKGKEKDDSNDIPDDETSGANCEEIGGEEFAYERKPGVIVHDFGNAEDMNKVGIQRAKKDVIQQEDAHCEHYPFNDDANYGLFCVFDGHGGKDAALAATQLMPDVIKKLLKQRTIKKEAGDILHVAFLTVDGLMREFEYEGCTATVVIIWKYKSSTYLQSANLGDSFAFVSNGNKFIELCQEHKLSCKHEQRRMEDLGIAINDGQTRIAGGIAITRALGDHFSKDNKSGMIAAPYVSKPIKLSGAPSTLILASDGLWDVMSGKVALAMAKKADSASSAAQKVMRVALKNKECKDNISVTVVRL